MPVDVKTFAKRIKEKYPAYKDVDDLTLSKRVVEKYPEYKDKVDLNNLGTVKKKRKYYLKFGRFFIGYSERGSNRAIGIFWRKSR